MSVKPSHNYQATSALSESRASFKWSLKKISLGCLKSDSIESPEFCSDDSTWALEICPKGSFFNVEAAVYLCNKAADWETKKVNYKISLQDKTGKDHGFLERECDFKRGGTGWPDTLSIDKALRMNEKQQYILPDDTLIVYVELKYVSDCDPVHSPMIRLEESEPSPVCPAEDASLDKLVADFKRIFKKQKYCDVILVSSDDQKFPAHKAILEERSSVFTAMFQHDMVESRSGEVRIEDIDGSTLKHLLHYIYTAKFDEVSDIDISRLYAAADKYNIETLKKKCLRHMLDNLSIDSVCIAIVLADMFKEKQLKESALAFLHKNASSVIKSETWKDFMKEHSYLAAEILETIVLDKKS